MDGVVNEDDSDAEVADNNVDPSWAVLQHKSVTRVGAGNCEL
jgi:hypothetical protein